MMAENAGFSNSRFPLKFCPNTSPMYRDYNLIDSIHKAKAEGFNVIETQNAFSVPKYDLREEIMNEKIEVKLINMIVHGNRTSGTLWGVACRVNHLESFKSQILESSKMADYLRCKYVHVLSGLKQKDEPVSQDVVYEKYIDNLKMAVEIFDEYNITPVIEPMSTPQDYYLNKFDTALEVIRDVGGNRIKLLLDYFHLTQMGIDIAIGTQMYLPYTAHIQVSQKLSGGSQVDGMRHEPFHKESTIDYKKVFNELIARRYNGYIGLEYTPTGVNSNDWIQKYI